MKHRSISRGMQLMLLSLALAACATQPKENIAISNLRDELDALRSDSELAALAPLPITEAERAVRAAGETGLKEDEQAHRILIAEKRIEIARSEAMHARSKTELEALESRRTALLLRASRLEVEQARREAERAQLANAATMEEIERTRMDADAAREGRARAREEAEQARRLADAQASEIELARREAQLATQAAESLRRRLEYMELRETDRGVVVTLGDVLFEVGKSDLHEDARTHLVDVVELLQSEPDNRIRIEGHTDASGPSELNLRLSQQRAEAVRSALADLGISADRITAVGMGEDFPIASNESDEGRARNRRVDVILLND